MITWKKSCKTAWAQILPEYVRFGVSEIWKWYSMKRTNPFKNKFWRRLPLLSFKMPTWIWKNFLRHRQPAKGPQGSSIPETFAKRPALLPARARSILRPCQLALNYGHCTSFTSTCPSRLCLELFLKSLVGCYYLWHLWLQTLLVISVYFFLWKLTSFHLGLEYLSTVTPKVGIPAPLQTIWQFSLPY